MKVRLIDSCDGYWIEVSNANTKKAKFFDFNELCDLVKFPRQEVSE